MESNKLAERIFNWFVCRKQQVLKAMKKHELFDHVIIVEVRLI